MSYISPKLCCFPNKIRTFSWHGIKKIIPLSFIFLIFYSAVSNAMQYNQCVTNARAKCGASDINGYQNYYECVDWESQYCQQSNYTALPKVLVEADAYVDYYRNIPFEFLLPNIANPQFPQSFAGSLDPKQDDGTPREETCLPVDISSGQKLLHEEDYVSNDENPLTIRREYNIYYKGGVFGNTWISPIDNKLSFLFNDKSQCEIEFGKADTDCNKTMSPSTIKSITLLDQGNFYIFEWSSSLSKWRYTGKDVDNFTLTQQSNGTWLLNALDGSTKTYYSSGLIASQYDIHGIGWIFSYNGFKVQNITHTSGRQLVFTWDNNASRVSAITLPTGRVINYSYVENSLIIMDGENSGFIEAHRLEKVTYPNSDVKKYHYESRRSFA